MCLMTAWIQTGSHPAGHGKVSFPVRPIGEVVSSGTRASTGGVSDDLVAGLLITHHSHADLLKTLGVDACALYQV